MKRRLSKNIQSILIPLFILAHLSCTFGANPSLKDVLQAEGLILADVGSGNGDWIKSLVEWVGPNGTIYATEVDSAKVERIKRKVERAGWDNVEVLLGDQRRTGLDSDCCHRILLRLVFHHFENPESMVSDLYRSLKPKGLVAIIDFEPNSYMSKSNIPSFRAGHGVKPEEVRRQMEKGGFTFLTHYDNWDRRDDRFLMLFEK